MQQQLPCILLAVLLASCAPAPSIPPVSPSRATPVDALLPSGRNLFLLDFVQGRYQRWTSAEACRLADTLQGRWADPSRWLALGTPGTPFAPVAAAAGPNGHFFLLDRIGRRLCLYDTNAQFLSGFPLPQELKERSPDRLEVHWTRDGIFTFLDLAEGAAWQFTETRHSGGHGPGGDWRLINRLRLPLNLESCRWEPFFRGPCCRVKGAAEARCFDRYFNPSDAQAISRDSLRGAGASPWSLSARPEGAGWMLRAAPAGGCDAGAADGACFHTDKGLLEACP